MICSYNENIWDRISQVSSRRIVTQLQSDIRTSRGCQTGFTPLYTIFGVLSCATLWPLDLNAHWPPPFTQSYSKYTILHLKKVV